MIRMVYKGLIIFVFFLALPIKAQFNKYLSKTTSDVHYTRFNINNISTYIYNNGEADSKPGTNSGLMFPKGTNKYVVYKSGFVWGGKVNDVIRVGGSTYNSGLTPGKILPDGTAENPNNENVRVYRVRSDYKTAELFSEINDGEGTEEEIRLQYELDWNEWPVEDGAPFNDLDKDGIYNPLIDVPGVSGADQTLWFVANDLDSNQSEELYGSLPMGLELQVTVWGYADRNIFDNMIFKKYKLINKGKADIKDMYISIWSDADVGDASNDFVGCDTLLNLVFAYNGNTFDSIYENKPPSVGLSLLKGPKVENDKNLKMTSFHFFNKHGDENYSQPDLGLYSGTLQYYNFMQGRIGNGSVFPVPDVFGGGVTKFPFSGDPINRTGFIEGILTVPQDRRMALGSGPFNMLVGDTQEILFSEIVAQGKDNLNSLQLLKYYVKQIPNNLNNLYEIEKFHIPLVPIPEFSAIEFTNYKEIILSIENNDEIVNFENNGY
ncbi:MAG: hypothetical protein PF445_00595, partial [Melioribacteraceae bacterium]|nr:hypothetical protein [Melioribacteraceae bacterium]